MKKAMLLMKKKDIKGGVGVHTLHITNTSCIVGALQYYLLDVWDIWHQLSKRYVPVFAAVWEC